MNLTTGAPQKLWRHVKQAMRAHGYNLVLWEDAPSVSRMAIGDTGTTHGAIAAEHAPQRQDPGTSINGGRLLAALLFLAGAIWRFSDAGVEAGWGWAFLVIAVALAAAAFETEEPRYRSRAICVELQGEVYASEAEVSNAQDQTRASTGRRSIVSEVQLVIRAACLESSKHGDHRRLEAALAETDCPTLSTDFDTITGAIWENIRPVVEMEEIRSRRGPP